MDLHLAYAPTTFSPGLLEAPFDRVVAAFTPWWSKIFPESDWLSESTDLNTWFDRLDPLYTPPNRSLWLETTAGWTAYFDNGGRGSDPVSPISVLAEWLYCWALHVIDQPFSLPINLPAEARFHLFVARPGEGAEIVRYLRAGRDIGRWEFDSEGTIQEFEEPQHYANRKIRDRFNSALLRRYCAAIGVRPWDSDFYTGRGLLVSTPPSPRSTPRSRARVQCELGLRLTGGDSQPGSEPVGPGADLQLDPVA